MEKHSSLKENNRIALIHPHGCAMNTFLPLSLAYLKSCLDEEKVDIKIIDCTLKNIKADSIEFEDELKSFDPLIVGVSTLSHTFFEALELIKRSKKLLPNVITIIGGAHASTYFEETIKNTEIDFLFRGEADISFSVFLFTIF